MSAQWEWGMAPGDKTNLEFRKKYDPMDFYNQAEQKKFSKAEIWQGIQRGYIRGMSFGFLLGGLMFGGTILLYYLKPFIKAWMEG